MAEAATRTGTRMRPGELAVVSFTHVVDDIYQGAVPALVALLVIERNYSYTAATGITLAATILSSVLQPLFGMLSDRRPMRWLVPVGLAFAGIGIGLAGVSDNYAWTWAAVALSGMGVAAYHPDAARLARSASGGTATGMSWFSLGGNVGFAIGPSLTTGVLLATGLAGSPLLAIPAVVTAAFLPLLLRRFSQVTASRKQRVADGDDDWRSFRWLTGAVVARSVLFFGLSALLALYLKAQYGTSAEAASAALTVLLATGAAATIVGGRLADRIGLVTVMRIGYVLAIPGIVGLVLAPGVVVAFAATVVLGVAVYLPFSVQVTLGQSYLPNRVGTASGVTLGLAVSAGGLVVPLLGLLADHTDLRVAIATLVVPALLALLATARLPERT
jgi:MFS transporter, FSR family, fosmidomycin resistance protein